MHRLTSIYARFAALADGLRSPFLLFVRLYWGWQFAVAGWGKLQHLDKITAFFSSLGIPFPGINAPLVAGLEFVGGILLALGLGTRLIGLLLTGNMLVAYLAGDREALHSIFSAPDKFIAADPFSYLFAAVIALVFGAGLFSVDARLARRMQARTEDE